MNRLDLLKFYETRKILIKFLSLNYPGNFYYSIDFKPDTILNFLK